jgi:arylsulfatase A-like enzyme
MLSIYPTLIDLCGLDAYQRNEGVNLAPLLRGETETAGEFALTTYGWGNHGVRTENYRYIRYSDGSEEFYDHTADPNEWDNLAQKATSENEMENLKKYLPETDVPYAEHSVYNFNPYFANDKLKHSR